MPPAQAAVAAGEAHLLALNSLPGSGRNLMPLAPFMTEEQAEVTRVERDHFSKYSSAQIERTARMRQFVELVKEENGTISEALEADFQDTRMYVCLLLCSA